MDKWIAAGPLMLSLTVTCLAQETDAIRLPAPEMLGGMPLMQALKERHSTREFSVKPLSLQVLSNLLWAADGVNRPDSGKRTAPSAHDWRDIDVFVATADGAYRYDPPTNTLKRVITGDIRKLTGMQDFVATAPVNLVYVTDLNRISDSSAEQKTFYSAADTGFIAENVYLFCASAGLATVVRGSVDRDVLGAALGLNSHQKIILAHSVGYSIDSIRQGQRN
jgi:SagB-type dehydrogenase family enzyme